MCECWCMACLWTHMCVPEVSVVPQELSALFPEQDPLEPGACWLGRLPGPRAPGTYLPVYLTSVGSARVHHHTQFSRWGGNQLMLAWKALHPLTHLTSLSPALLNSLFFPSQCHFVFILAVKQILSSRLGWPPASPPSPNPECKNYRQALPQSAWFFMQVISRWQICLIDSLLKWPAI